MSVILNIDTALETASVCIAENGQPLANAINKNQKDHAAWLHPAIKEITDKSGYTLNKLDAIAVTIGPGSYTGLRVGLSAAKGLCYALRLPLITVGTLQVIAAAHRDKKAGYICPMIDARRMEVFTALYTPSLKEITGPHALIPDAGSFESYLSQTTVLFCGNGSKKTQSIITHINALFADDTPENPADMAFLSHENFLTNTFSELAYTEPLYIKEFYQPR